MQTLSVPQRGFEAWRKALLEGAKAFAQSLCRADSRARWMQGRMADVCIQRQNGNMLAATSSYLFVNVVEPPSYHPGMCYFTFAVVVAKSKDTASPTNEIGRVAFDVPIAEQSSAASSARPAAPNIVGG